MLVAETTQAMLAWMKMVLGIFTKLSLVIWLYKLKIIFTLNATGNIHIKMQVLILLLYYSKKYIGA